MKSSKVICVHIGARAHYLLPKAIHASGQLHALITDTWIRSGPIRRILSASPLRSLRALAGRYTHALSSSSVYSLGIPFLVYDFYLRLRYTYSWTLIVLRDEAFKKQAARKLLQIQDATSVFAISYTALDCFKIARERNMKTILFQIDPGLEEEAIVRQLVASTTMHTDWHPAPAAYWAQCREEQDLSDVIIVNSVWSKTGLIAQGISADKIAVIPLPYELEPQHVHYRRHYPSRFTAERPLRCLFLGTLTLRKGIHVVLEAARLMQGLPVEFIFVGRSEIELQELDLPNIQYAGIITRDETNNYYKTSDVFLFPTFSDGFGLTQLEAMAWQLPVIATNNCGDVVRHGHNGWLLERIDAAHLVDLLKQLLENSEHIALCSEHCLSTVQTFSVEKFTEDIAALV